MMENSEIENGAKNSSEENKNTSEENKNNSKPRYYRKNNKRAAVKRNSLKQKRQKLERLEGEREGKSAVLKRGYRIAEVKDDQGNISTKHLRIKGSERPFITADIADLDIQIFDLKNEIETLDTEITLLSGNKTVALKEKLKDSKNEKKVSKLFTKANDFLSKSESNGQKGTVEEIKNKVQNKQMNEALNSLKSFLRTELSPVAKSLKKSEPTEVEVLLRLIERWKKVSINLQ